MLLGSTFLLNIGVLMGSGVKLNDALAKMEGRAKPWLRERLNATLYGVRSGSNLGQSLDRAGFDFPDKRAVQFLRVISGLQGADQNMERFGERWLAQSIKSLQKIAGLLLGLAILLNAGLMILVLVGTHGISQAVMAGMHG
jgi:type II secretory pathway component PulF